MSQRAYRPAETYLLPGDASKARKSLDWQPVVREIVREDFRGYGRLHLQAAL